MRLNQCDAGMYSAVMNGTLANLYAGYICNCVTGCRLVIPRYTKPGAYSLSFTHYSSLPHHPHMYLPAPGAVVLVEPDPLPGSQ